MSKFKVGNLVRLLKNDSCGCYRTNDIVVVTQIREDEVYFLDCDGSTRFVFNCEVELVEDQPMPTPEYSCIRVVPPSKPKREIVTGEVRLSGAATIEVVGSQTSHKTVLIGIDNFFFNKDALREAAALFTTLAEVLEENENA